MNLDNEEHGAQAVVVDAAWRFLRPFYGAGDLFQAWPSVDPVLRLCWAQWWLTANQQALEAEGFVLAEVAQALSGDQPDHQLWTHFQRVLVRDIQAASPIDLDEAGIGSTPRVMGIDVELLYLHGRVPPDGVWPAGASAEVVPVVMHFSEGRWRVLNLGYESIPEPGWPPQLWDQVSQ